MKRQLIVEVDCGDTHCQECWYLSADSWCCYAFKNHDGDPTSLVSETVTAATCHAIKRCRKCLAAEAKARKESR